MNSPKNVLACALLSVIAGIWTANADSARVGPKIQIRSISFDPNVTHPIQTAQTGVPFIITVNLSNPGDMPAKGSCTLELIRNGAIVATKTVFADTFPPSRLLNQLSQSIIEVQFTLKQPGDYIARATWFGRKDYDKDLTATKDFSFSCVGTAITATTPANPGTTPTASAAQDNQAATAAILRQQQLAAATAAQQVQLQPQQDMQQRIQKQEELARQQNERASQVAREGDLGFRLALANRDAQVVQQMQTEKAEQARQQRINQHQQAEQQEQAVGAAIGLINTFQSAVEQGAQQRAAKEQAGGEQTVQDQAVREQAALEEQARQLERGTEQMEKANAMAKEAGRRLGNGDDGLGLVIYSTPEEAQAAIDQAEREKAERELISRTTPKNAGGDKQIWPSTSGGWTLSDSSVFADTANGWLHIAANGTYDDKAEKVVDISLPVVVEGRARLVSGGLGYTFPSFEFPFGSDGAEHFGITSAGVWPYTLDVTTARPVPSENTWITFRAIFRQDGGQIFAKYDTDTSFFPGQSKSWTVTNHISAIRFRQNWDSVCDLDYLIIADYHNN
jgi:hypothetical protein